MDSVIEDNEVGAKHIGNSTGPKKSTRATLVGVVDPGKTSAELDFSESLLLSSVGIAEARCVLRTQDSPTCAHRSHSNLNLATVTNRRPVRDVDINTGK